MWLCRCLKNLILLLLTVGGGGRGGRGLYKRESLKISLSLHSVIEVAAYLQEKEKMGRNISALGKWLNTRPIPKYIHNYQSQTHVSLMLLQISTLSSVTLVTVSAVLQMTVTSSICTEWVSLYLRARSFFYLCNFSIYSMLCSPLAYFILPAAIQPSYTL